MADYVRLQVETPTSVTPDGPTGPDVEETSFVADGGKEETVTLSLHEAAENGDAEKVQEILQSLQGQSEDARENVINGVDEKGWAALHYAAKNNHLPVIEALLLNGADPDVRSSGENIVVSKVDTYSVGKESTALHVAAAKSHVMAAKLLLNQSEHLQRRGSETSLHLTPADVNAVNKDNETPIYFAANEGSVEMATLLLKNGAKETINKAPTGSWPPLPAAVRKRCAGKGSVEMIRLLLANGAEESISVAVSFKRNAVHMACFDGCMDALKVLLAKDEGKASLKMADFYGDTPLMIAIKRGFEDVVKTILKLDHETIRTVLMTSTDENTTTPLREAIKKMPDAAVMMLDSCATPCGGYTSSHVDFRVQYVYSILEDYQDDDDSSLSCIQVQDHAVSCFQKELPSDECINKRGPQWGPKGFDRKNLPLNLIAQSENLELLKHPLVTQLLKRKWKVPAIFYSIGLLFYCIFLAFLTAFALSAPSPISESCRAVSGVLGNASFVDGCELSDSRQQFIFTAAIFVVILALIRLMSEVFQMYHYELHYFTDWVNWMEFFMSIFAIMFVWVFNSDCLCPFNWQWQIGTIAVFFAWFDFIIFVQKLPTVGIYVAMLKDILQSFIKTIPLAIMLVVAFALGFFMLFSEPGILRSPFSTPARALLTTIAFSTGGFDYSGQFRLTPGGTEDSDVEEIPFPPVSYMLFIAFVIIMSILLSNLLTGLAVGDTDRILRNAEAKNISQKIQLILNVDAILPTKIRRMFFVYDECIDPNKLPWAHWSLWQDKQPKAWWKRWLRRLLEKYLEWYPIEPEGIEIANMLKREDDIRDELKQSQEELKESLKEELKQSQEESKQSQEELKQSLKEELKQSQEELKQLKQSLKQSHEEIMKMMQEVLHK